MPRSRRQFLQSLSALLFAPTTALATAEDIAGRLVVSYNDDYAPYSFDDGGRVAGILPEILDPILNATPNLHVRNLAYPWRRAQAVVQQGEADALCTFASEERRRYALMHEIPVAVLRPALFYSATHPRRQEIEAMGSVAELRTLSFADQIGNQWAEENLRGFPKVHWVGGHDHIFRMVTSMRVDAHISLSPLVTRWRLKKLGITGGIVSRAVPFFAAEVPFHLLLRKAHPRAAEILHRLDGELAKPAQQRRIEAVIARYS